MTQNTTDWPVMKSHCSTCPFKPNSSGEYQNPEIATMVIARMIYKHSGQICHHPRINGKKETHLCRGARDYLLPIFYRMGVIKAPTDEAWAEAWEKMKAGS